MAGSLGFDDKILGEKTNYYCSSSEESEGEEDGGFSSVRGPTDTVPEAESQFESYSGSCTNTGPKGVIKDWQRYKQLETERREDQELEKAQLLKKLSITCRSHLDDEKEKEEDKDYLELLEEIDDDFIKEYRQRRIEEMRRALDCVPKFGRVISVNKDQFVDEIDRENPQVTIVIHIYENGLSGCEAMNGCITCLAEEYPTVKFCKIRASEAKMSLHFAENGVPALLVYKNGELIGSHVRLMDEFGSDFFSTDVESFLMEHGYLPPPHLGGIISSTGQHNSHTAEDSD